MSSWLPPVSCHIPGPVSPRVIGSEHTFISITSTVYVSAHVKMNLSIFVIPKGTGKYASERLKKKKKAKLASINERLNQNVRVQRVERS